MHAAASARWNRQILVGRLGMGDFPAAPLELEKARLLGVLGQRGGASPPECRFDRRFCFTERCGQIVDATDRKSYQRPYPASEPAGIDALSPATCRCWDRRLGVGGARPCFHG